MALAQNNQNFLNNQIVNQSNPNLNQVEFRQQEKKLIFNIQPEIFQLSMTNLVNQLYNKNSRIAQ